MVTSSFKQFFFLLLLCSTFHLRAQNNATPTVLATEQARFDAMIRRDTVSLQNLLAEDLVYIHSNTLKESKSAHIRSIASGKLVYQTMVREGTTVRFYGKTALTSGNLAAKGIINGNPFDVKMLYTAVYRKKKQRWQLVNWQSTRIP